MNEHQDGPPFASPSGRLGAMERRPSRLFSGQFTGALLAAVLLLSLAVNLGTIISFPSWDDEAYMANISLNLAQGKGRIFDMLPGFQEGEINRYGPIFFAVQSFFIRHFGLHDWLFRLPNLTSAYLSILLIALVLQGKAVARKWVAFYIIFAILDISVNRNLVSGRMDMMATFFVTISLYLASLLHSPPRLGWLRWPLVGTAAALGFLTSPRALFLLPMVIILGWPNTWDSRGRSSFYHSLRNTSLALLGFLGPILVWIWSLGGFAAYWAVQQTDVVRGHIAPSFLRSPYDNIAILVMHVLALIGARRVLRSPLLQGLLANYLIFSFFAREVGPYAAMIMPFVLAAVAVLLSEIRGLHLLKALLTGLMILPGSLVLAARGADLPLNAACRQASSLNALTRRMKDEGRGGLKAIADWKYYFQLAAPGNQVTALDGWPLVGERKGGQSLDNIDVLIRNSADSSPPDNFTAAAELSCKPRRIPILPGSFYERSTYNETVYLQAPSQPASQPPSRP
jgi:hypothetical protein